MVESAFLCNALKQPYRSYNGNSIFEKIQAYQYNRVRSYYGKEIQIEP